MTNVLVTGTNGGLGLGAAVIYHDLNLAGNFSDKILL